jgi:hypothetical protein
MFNKEQGTSTSWCSKQILEQVVFKMNKLKSNNVKQKTIEATTLSKEQEEETPLSKE